MQVPTTEEALEQMIKDQVQESQALDYKAAGALARNPKAKEEITKDVSAMANAEGGVIIYGVKEYDDPTRKHYPELITPIDTIQFSREWLDQILNLIRPQLPVVIHPVPLRSAPNHTAYVVEIPKATTAHQATDLRYYQRRNFLAEPMQDYQIQDVRNRRRFPSLWVAAHIASDQHGIEWALHFQIANVGDVLAEHFSAIIHMPMKWRDAVLVIEDKCVLDELDDGAAFKVSFNNALGSPLFPKSSRHKNFKFRFGVFKAPPPERMIKDIRYRVYADAMPYIEGRFDPDAIVKARS